MVGVTLSRLTRGSKALSSSSTCTAPERGEPTRYPVPPFSVAVTLLSSSAVVSSTVSAVSAPLPLVAILTVDGGDAASIEPVSDHDTFTTNSIAGAGVARTVNRTVVPSVTRLLSASIATTGTGGGGGVSSSTSTVAEPGEPTV